MVTPARRFASTFNSFSPLKRETRGRTTETHPETIVIYPPERTGFEAIIAAVRGTYSKKRLFLAVAISALSFCAIVNSSWNATPDSALYLALGESLASGAGYVFNGEPHTFVPPGFPSLIAATAYLMGPHFLSYRLLMALIGMLTAWLGYLFVRRLCGRDAALMVGGLFAVNHALLYNCSFVLSDVPFAMVAMVALHAVLSAGRTERPLLWAVLAGLTVGLLPMVRVNGLGVPPAAAFFLFCSWKPLGWPKRLSGVAIFLAVALVPTILWTCWKASFPVSHAEGGYWNAILGRSDWDQIRIIAGALWGYFPEISEALTGLTIKTGFLELLPPLLVGTGMVVAFRSGDRLLVPVTAVQFCGLLLSSPGSRYLVFLIPALYLFLALGVLAVIPRLSRRDVTPAQSGRILVACFAIMALFNVSHNAITIVKARTPLEAKGPESERSLPFFTAARWLKTHAPHATVLTTRSRIVHYLSGCPTVSLLRSGVPEKDAWVSKPDEIAQLIRQRNPEFLFTDSSKADLYEKVIEVLRDMGARVEPIPEANSSPRYRLYRIVAPPHWQSQTEQHQE